MNAARTGRIGTLGIVAAIVPVAIALIAWLTLRDWTRPAEPETIVSASLAGLREQNVLVPFAARFVAVVTSTQSRFGLSAKKTLIMPGNVRYELDLAALEQDDLDWDGTARQLTVTLPPLRIAGPEVDMTAISEFAEGAVLLSLTDAEAALDAANRRAGQQELLAQAKAPAAMKLARNAARAAVERSFALPLNAAGLDATVVARFADEAGYPNPEQMDRSRTPAEVLGTPPPRP